MPTKKQHVADARKLLAAQEEQGTVDPQLDAMLGTIDGRYVIETDAERAARVGAKPAKQERGQDDTGA